MNAALFLAPLLFALPLAAADFPWKKRVPADLVQEAVQPDRVAGEDSCDWRPVLTPIAEDVVRDCATAKEAVLKLAAELPQVTGVRYSTERRKHNMNALEALEEKKVSCTGQSVLLVCALRAVGIPARMVGLLTWNHVRGNHSWAEAWFDGDWHMIEYAEHDFNTPWVMENIGMLDPKELTQRIQAITPAGKEPFLPSYAMEHKLLPAVNVSERYARLAQDWYAQSGAKPEEQRLLVDLIHRTEEACTVRVENEQGECVSSATLPTTQDDVRYFARLTLPREGQHYLRIGERAERTPLHCTPAPVQILRADEDGGEPRGETR